MERLFLGYETAFWIWRKAGPLAFSALQPTRVRSLAGGAPTRSKVDLFLADHPDLASGVVDLIVQSGDQRAIAGVRNHVKSGQLPDRSFYRLDDGLYVASPELCLLQLAGKLAEPQAIKLAMEFCGTYAIDVHDEDMGFVKRPALTSATKLNAYAKRLHKPGGGARAIRPLRHVVDASASPRETALCMLLCLPPRLGGYGIALPELNRRIELTLKEQLAIGVHHFLCDLYWADRGVAVEYDSARFHSVLEKQERDAIRRNMLQYKGIHVISATRLQVSSEAQFDNLARQIALRTGKRLRTPTRAQVTARRALRETLFDWDVLQQSPIDAEW